MRHWGIGIPALVAAVLAGSAAYFFFAYVPQERAALIRTTAEGLAGRAEVRLLAVERWVKDNLEDAATIAAFPSVRRSLGTEGGVLRRAAKGSEPHADDILRIFAETQGFARILVVDAGGRVAARSDRGPPVEAAGRSVVATALAERSPQAAFHLHRDGRPMVAFAQPVVAGRRGSPASGAVLIEVDPALWLYPFIAAAPTGPASSEALLVQQDGDSVSWLTPLRKSGAPPLTYRRSLAETRGLAAAPAIENRAGFGSYRDYVGAPIFAATRPVAGTRWGLVVKVDQADVLAPFRREMGRAAARWGALLLALGGIALLLWRRQLREAELSLARGQARTAAALDQANDIVLFVGLDGHIEGANRRAVEFYGGGPDGPVGRHVFDLRPPELRASGAGQLATVAGEGHLLFETVHLAADGTPVPVEASSRRVALPDGDQIVSVIRDVRERKAAEAHIQRLNRALRTISEINQLILREAEPARLFAEACRILVEHGGFRMAWIGAAEPDGLVRPTAHAGAEAGYLAEAVIRWDDSGEGRGPTGTAVRERRTVACQDLAADSAVAPWRDAALSRGYGSSLACPILSGTTTAGVLTVYAGEPGVFDAEVTALLEELSGDLGFALLSKEDRAARESAERDARSTNRRLGAILDTAPVPIVSVAPDGVVTTWNPTAERVFGWTAAETVGRPNPIIPPERRGEFQEVVARALGGTAVVGFETQRLRKDGTLVDVLMSTAALPDAEGAPAGVVALLMDLTELRRAEAALSASNAKLRAFFESSATGMLFGDVAGNIVEANDEFLRIVGYTRDDLASGRLRWADITPPEFAAADAEAIAEATARGTCTPFEKQYIRKDGARVWVLVGFVLLGERREQSAAFIVDITGRKQAEAAVHSSEGRYRSLFHGMLEGYAHCRMEFAGDVPVDWVYLDVNPAFSALSGLTGAVGKRVTEVIPGIRETNPDLFELYGRVARTGQPERLETYVPALGIWFSIAVYCPALGEFVSVFDNITERRATEKALRESNELNAQVVATAQEGVIVYDRDLRYVAWNPFMESLTGKTADEVRGRVAWEVFPQLKEMGVDEALRRALAGETVTEPDAPVAPRRTPDRWVSRRYGPFRNAAGEIVGVLGTVRDVTEQRAAEEELREREERFRSLYENATIGLYRTTPEGRIILANPAVVRMLGYESFAELAGRDLEVEGYEPGYARSAFRDRIAATGAIHGLEASWQRRDGTTVVVRESARAVRDAEGTLRYYEGTVEDITDRKRAEDAIRELNAQLEARVAERTEQLEAANQELEAFAYSVSHDLRAPLRAIDGFGRMLEEEHAPRLDDEGRRLLGVVRSSTKGMGHLIDDLLAFSRAGRGAIEKSAVDMTALARSVWESVTTPAERKAIAFQLDALPTAECDPALMRLVWANLLANAVKFTAPKAHRVVEVRARREAARTMYVVKDNGVGFDPKYLAKLFGVFQRLHSAAEFEGTGVGLALVQRIIRRHGGEICGDGAVGEGATFFFTLPHEGDPE